MFKDLSKDEIEQLLSAQMVGRIGLHADDITYVVPISYGYDGHYLYARTYEGKKLDMLRKNPRVCFQVDDTCDLSNWKSVICWGLFEELTNLRERESAITILQKRKIPLVASQTMRLSGEDPFTADNELIPGVFFRIRITEKTGRTEVSSSGYYYAT